MDVHVYICGGRLRQGIHLPELLDICQTGESQKHKVVPDGLNYAPISQENVSAICS